MQLRNYRLIMSAAVAIACTATTHAADFTWGGGNSTWADSSPTGWNGGVPGNGDTATINTGTVTATTNNQQAGILLTIGPNGVLNDGGNYLYFSGGSLTLNSGTINVSLVSGGIYRSGGLGATVTANSGISSINNTGADQGLALENGGTTFNGSGNLTLGLGLLDHWSGAAGVTKSGAGSLTMTAVSGYTGATTVSGGTLKLDATGTINNTSGVSIGAGEFNYNSTTALSQAVSFSGSTGTLSGTGTITPAVTITSGNLQTAGTSVTSVNTTATVGSQTFTNGITYNADSIFEWNLNANNDVGMGTRGTDYDAVNTLGLNTTDTKAIFRVILNGTDNFDEAFWNTDRTWANIFTGLDGSSSLNIADVFKTSVEYYNSAGLVTNANATRSFSLSGTSLVWSAVPEPATTTLAGLLLTAGLLRRRR